MEGQISRLVQWIAKGKLVEDLEAQMVAAEAQRDHLRQELARARAAEPATGIDVLPAAVRKIVSALRGMLAAGQVEQVKSALSRLVTSIEVHEDPRPGRKRPGAKLEVRGNLEALLQLTGKVESGGSPGGILAPLTFHLPPRKISLHRRHASVCASDQQRRPGCGLKPAGCTSSQRQLLPTERLRAVSCPCDRYTAYGARHVRVSAG